MRRTIGVLASLLLILAGAACSSSSGVQFTSTKCSEKWATGTELTEGLVTDAGCVRDEEGDNFYPASARMDCTDGRELVWNDVGWGFMGEEWTHQVNGSAPDDVVAACKGNS